MGTTYIIKFKFAGSRDKFWRKVKRDYEKAHVPNSAQQEDMLSNIEKNPQLKQEVERMYGKPVNNCPGLWYRQRVKNGFQYIEFSLTGPGISDRMGDHTIQKNFDIALGILPTLILDMANKSTTEKVYVKIKGHSRGGVMANRVINNLSNNSSLNKHPKIVFCSVSYDPVPGQQTGLFPQPISNLTQQHTGDDVKITMGELVHGAVIYSLNPDKNSLNLCFEPQKVKNSKVLIISENDHSMGLYKTAEAGRPHKLGYTWGSKYFKPGGVWRLPEGAYWADKDHKLKRISEKNLNNFVKQIQSNCPSPKRKEILTNLLYEQFRHTYNRQFSKLISSLHETKPFDMRFLKLAETAYDFFKEDGEFSKMLKDVYNDYCNYTNAGTQPNMDIKNIIPTLKNYKTKSTLKQRIIFFLINCIESTVKFWQTLPPPKIL